MNVSRALTYFIKWRGCATRWRRWPVLGHLGVPPPPVHGVIKRETSGTAAPISPRSVGVRVGISLELGTEPREPLSFLRLVESVKIYGRGVFVCSVSWPVLETTASAFFPWMDSLVGFDGRVMEFDLMVNASRSAGLHSNIAMAGIDGISHDAAEKRKLAGGKFGR